MRTGQTKRVSALESVLNVLIGYGVAVGSQIIIFPYFGINIPMSDNFVIGGYFTLISLARSFLVRRMFNYWHVKGVL